MAFDTVQEIKDVIKEKEEDKNDLITRMEKDWDLLTLKEFISDQGKGHESYTSSAPANHFLQILDGVNQAVLTLQIQLSEKATKPQRKAASEGELYLQGALYAIDRRLNNIGEPPLREGLAHFICNRGWYGLRALVYVPKGKTDTVFDVMPWDPLHLTWEHGADGLIWCAYKRLLSKARTLSEYGHTINGKYAIITDFWDEDRNSVIIDDAFAKEPKEHKIEHVPVLIGAVGSMPTIQRNMVGATSWSNETHSTLEHRGDSVWSASRNLYNPQNRYISYVFDTAKRSVAGSLVYETEDGHEANWDGDPYESYQAVPIKFGESLRPLELPKAPPETAAVLSVIDNDIQRSTLPNPDFPDRAESGRALAIRLEATRKVYGPRTEAVSRCYQWLAEELLNQFATKGDRPVDLYGYDSNGDFFQVSTKPTDIDKGWIIKAPVEPRLPRDEEAEMNLYLAATSSRDGKEPAVSRHYGRERIIKLDDPDAEHEKILAQIGEELPPIMIANVAAALKERGNPELAEQVLATMSAADAAPDGAGPGAPPEVIEPIVEALVKIFVGLGLPEEAEALVSALQGGTAPAQPVPDQGPAPANVGAGPIVG